MRKLLPACCWLFWLSLFLWNGATAQPDGAKPDRYFHEKMEKAGLIGLQAGLVQEGEMIPNVIK